MSLNNYNSNVNGLNNSYGNSSYGVSGLNNSFGNMSFQQAGGAPVSTIPMAPPLPQQSFFPSNRNSFLGDRNLRTREWSQLNNSQWGSTQYISQPQSYQSYSAIPSSTTYTQTSYVPATTTVVSAAPAVAAVPANMLPAPINDGRRYARLTGQKAGSRRSRRHLVQPLNGTGLTTLPAGVPVEGLAAASVGNTGRRSRRAGQNAGNASFNNAAGFPGTSNYVSLGNPSSSFVSSSQSAIPFQQQQQFISAPAASTTYVSSAPVVSTPIVVAAPAVAAVPSNMLPAPINDGRRYARLTGQKAGSRRSRRHLVQPLNGTGLTTLPAGVPVEGLAAAAAGNGRRSRRMRGQNSGLGYNNGTLMSAPLAPSTIGGTTALAAPHLAQIPLGAPRAGRRSNNRSNRGLNSGYSNASFVPVTTAPVMSAQPMIKQEILVPVSQPYMVGGATF